MTPEGNPRNILTRLPVAALLGIVVLWGSWSTLVEMEQVWSFNPTYSHGYLVPLIALALLWSVRDRRPPLDPLPGWSGLTVFLVGAAAQLAGAYWHVRWLCGVSFLFYLAGLVVLVGGWRSLRWAGPSVGFLAFMIPLPYRVQTLMQQPLQQLSTVVSGYALQTLGFPAVIEGNLIYLDNVELGIVDACSGLRMFILFVAISTATALLVRSRSYEKAIIVLSAVPIAIISNVTRITITGVCYETVGSRWGLIVFHDMAGWLMIVLAMVLLFLELTYLSHLFVDQAGATPGPPVRP